MRSRTYLIILGEEFGEFLMPPFRCFFLGDNADCWSSSTATESESEEGCGAIGTVDSQQAEREAGWRGWSEQSTSTKMQTYNSAIITQHAAG